MPTYTGTNKKDSIYGSYGNDTILGLEDDDDLEGDTGDDSIEGGSGNDYINGEPGADTILGGDGNDSISGGAGNDVISGGDGDDQINYSDDSGNDTVYGGAGNDLMSYYLVAGNKNLFGEFGNDTIYGATGNDLINGGDGNDRLTGEPGNDFLLGGDGNDSISGGAGNDVISGGDGDDQINYSDDSGNDTVSGGSGNDFVSYYLVSGNKTIGVDDGKDTVYGAIGNDSISGGNGDDDLSGYAGNDTLDGGQGTDSIYGGIGDDSILGGAGNDTLQGDEGNDYLDGGVGVDVLLGYTGNDYIYGGEGNDQLYGFLGKDTLDGGSGGDEMFAGDGDDTYYVDSIFDFIDDSGGTDTAYVSTSFVKLPSTIENINYTNGALALPYWISALLPDDAAGKKFTTLLGDSKSFGYFFPSTLPSYDTDTDHAKGYTTFSSAQKAKTVIALSYISSVLDVSFTEKTTASGLNTLSFASNNQTGSSGYAQYPSSSFSGSDLFLKIADYNTTLADGTYGAYTLMHELGHALGLKHPFDEKDAAGNVEVPPYLQGSEDSTTWTYISYNYSSSEYYLRYSPLDIAALQYLYGPSKSARIGNDKYTITSSSANFIWDGAGTDLIDASAVNQSATIYLTPGYWGYLGTTKTSTITSSGQITVNFGSVIENLTGSAYADKLYGNEIGNSIDGGLGNDLLEGWAGNDSLLGGAGNDSISGGAGNDLIYGGDGDDTINYLYADSGNDTVYAGAGNDLIKYINLFSGHKYVLGEFGNDTIYGADGNDTLDGGQGNDFIEGGTLNDFIFGGDGNDTIDGGLSDDILDGGDGIDTLTVSGTSLNYTISYSATSLKYTIVDKRKTDGTDTFSNIEYISYSDKAVLLSSIDFTPPTITITSNKTVLTAGQTATLTFVLSEASNNFDINDILVSGGALSNFSGSGLTYTATFTPSDNLKSSAQISVVNGKFSDLSGNLNEDGSDANNLVSLSVFTAPNPSIIGTNAPETFNTLLGNDSINGGGGIDTVVVSAGIANYSVTKTATGYTVFDKVGSDGTDTLLNVEAIKFTDKTINLTVQAKAASAPQADVTRLVELYTAFFNRVPDADGMSFWIDEMKAGKTTNQVAEAFYNAGVNYSSLTGFSSSMNNADFINVIYKNVLGRKDGADAGGLSFWETEITSGRATRGTLVTNILDSAHTFKGNATWGWVADLLDNKITVAKKFSIDMGLNYNTPEESITKGMAIASAITATDTSAAITLIGVTEANFQLY